MAEETPICSISKDDPRIAGQHLGFLLGNVSCKVKIHAGRGKRASVLGSTDSNDAPDGPLVFASLAVTDQRLVLDLKRDGPDEKEMECFNIAYEDEKFQELGLGFSSEQTDCHIMFVLQDSKKFLNAALARAFEVPDKASFRVSIATPHAPDIAIFVNRILKQGGEVDIKPTDPRISGETTKFNLSNLKCRLEISAGTSNGASSGQAKRGSVYMSTQDDKSVFTVLAALAITETKVVLDVKRIEKDAKPLEYLNLSLQNELCKEARVEFSNEVTNGRLVLTLPDARRFLGDVPSFAAPEGSTAKVYLDTFQAPDIAMLLTSKGIPGVSSSGIDCLIKPEDSRLADEIVVFLLNSMKCRLQLVVATPGGKRGSIYEMVDAPSSHSVFAALAVTESKILLDMQRSKKDPHPQEYLQIDYKDALCKDIGFEFANSTHTNHLLITLPDATRFLNKAGSFEVPPNSTVKIYMDSWKAPDISMYVKQKQRNFHKE
mmetsp:Transcript_96375/g.171294  ORF Transcript_96375/g.171294 Transcript_96375/m.171294 type:complete len:489 (-) Transcript_96375:173-1639(-)